MSPQLPEGLAFGVEAEVAEPDMSQGALVFLAIVVFTIVIIYVTHLIMLKISRESPILQALNTMDREKRILLHENTTLHEELCKSQAELETITSHITESSGDVIDLDNQLEEIKREHVAETALQEEKIVQLEHELEEATSNSLEMHKMLSEMLSAQKDTSTFQNEELHLELSSSREQVTKFDSQIQQLTQSLKELSTSKEENGQQLMKEVVLVKELQNINESLSKQSVDNDQQLSDLNQELQALQETIASLRESVETKDSELKVAKECMKKFQLTSQDAKDTPDDEKLSSLFDVIKIKAELDRVSSERLNLEDQLKESEMAQKNLEDTMSSIRSEVTELRTVHDEAINEKQEAVSKLAVLTQYFEGKEAQLTRDVKNLPEAKRGLIHRMSMEHFNLAGLSPTTENVPVSDEYKVEWAKAKAELRQQKLAVFQASGCDDSEQISGPSVECVLQSSDSSHSSDSAQCLSESAHSLESSFSQETRSVNKSEQSESIGISPKVNALPSDSFTPSAGNFSGPSLLRPSSLKISPRIDHLSSGHMNTNDVLSASSMAENLNLIATQLSCVDGALNLCASVNTEGPSRPAYGLGLHSGNLVDIGTVYDTHFDMAIQETAASDDVKSTVAAMKSIFERDAQLRSLSDTFSVGSNEKLPFGPTMKSSHSSRTQIKVEEKEFEALSPDVNLLQKKKKGQVTSLQKELQDQEKSYKTQLDGCEKKAHDNWLQARAAERKHEEQRQENSQLRNRLTLFQKEREDMQSSILKPTPKRLDANGRMPSPGPIIEGELDGEHSESPPHYLHGPPSLPMMLPPGAPLPPGIPPPHGFPGAPPPPPPPGMPRGVPPPFHPGEFPFMRPPLPPLPGDRRLPPAGGMSSPPFRRSGSPPYSHRNDRYSPSSEHSHLSDRHYSPPPMRHRPPSPDMHRRNHSPDRRSDRLRSPDRRSDRAPDHHHHHSNRRTPDRRLDRRSPDRHFSTRSPDGYHRHSNPIENGHLGRVIMLATLSENPTWMKGNCKRAAPLPCDAYGGGCGSCPRRVWGRLECRP
ncbi:Transport and Golgi organization protein 1 [Chionoecetes opilio]|uniref:Transport and Golgi organization protein 1 n=1 Tax=Chionoecetes opilio TaxID=41210 RepID=A0A8J4Y8S5_CHIOP|nr:Transport and Golgi organization protein 1 [Chionoecetes opilio]